MPEIAVKSERRKANPRDPRTYADYDRGVAMSKRGKWYEKKVAGMTPGMRADYDKALASNPSNIPGMDILFPALSLTSSMAGVRAARECKVKGCGGCCTHRDGYVCPRCGTDNSQEE